MPDILQSILGNVAEQAGAEISQNPDVQKAVEQAKAWGSVATVAAVLVFVFYFVPRFENPVPRVWRRR